MSQKPAPGPEPPVGPPPPSYTPSEVNASAPPPQASQYMNAPNMEQSMPPNNVNNFAPNPQMGYPPPQGQYPPQQGYPPPVGGYYAPYQANPQNGNFGQPPYGAYNAGAQPQGQFVDSNRGKGNPGFAEGLLAACACCCCLDLLF